MVGGTHHNQQLGTDIQFLMLFRAVVCIIHLLVCLVWLVFGSQDCQDMESQEGQRRIPPGSFEVSNHLRC